MWGPRSRVQHARNLFLPEPGDGDTEGGSRHGDVARKIVCGDDPKRWKRRGVLPNPAEPRHLVGTSSRALKQSTGRYRSAAHRSPAAPFMCRAGVASTSLWIVMAPRGPRLRF